MSNIQVRACTEYDRQLWDAFVNDHPACTSYHRWSWKLVFEQVFGWPAIYLIAEQNGAVRGILPLIRQKCCLRTYLSSMPHLKGGGIVADSADVEHQLFAAATEAARQVYAKYLELRHVTPHELPATIRQDKVAALLSIGADDGMRLQRLDKKTRNLVRKSLTYGMTIEFGGPELVPEFYRIYRQNMHDLGSPAYSPRFFSEILARFPGESHVCVARLGQEEVAAGFLVGFRDTIEMAWASSYRKFLHLKPNMFLYWNVLSFAADRGYRWLDFGRSSRDSSTLAFKMQWGAVPSELYWSYWPNQHAEAPRAGAGGMQLASRVWRRLPLTLTNAVGPALIRHIPGI